MMFNKIIVKFHIVVTFKDKYYEKMEDYSIINAY